MGTHLFIHALQLALDTHIFNTVLTGGKKQNYAKIQQLCECYFYAYTQILLCGLLFIMFIRVAFPLNGYTDLFPQHLAHEATSCIMQAEGRLTVQVLYGNVQSLSRT